MARFNLLMVYQKKTLIVQFGISVTPSTLIHSRINNAISMVWTKTVHLSFYFLDSTMPDSVKTHIEELKTQNPEFSVMVWGPQESRELVESRYPQYLKKYDGYPFAIQRSDFSRYAILHAHGGVYVDMDYTLKKPLVDIFAFLDVQFGQAEVFVNETPNAVFLRRLSNSFMISRAPLHNFWLHVMNTTNSGNGLSSHQRVISSTGPQAIDRAYKSFKEKRDKVGVLPKKHFNPCSLCERGNKCQQSTHVFAFHENAGGWNSNTGRLYNSLHCNMWWCVLFVFLIVFIVTLCCVLSSTRARCKLKVCTTAASSHPRRLATAPRNIKSK